MTGQASAGTDALCDFRRDAATAVVGRYGLAMPAKPIRVRYDDLRDAEQSAVRAEWDDRVAATLAGLDFTATLRGRGEPWAEADEDGAVVMREAAPPGG